jgi:hypothetical protein
MNRREPSALAAKGLRAFSDYVEPVVAHFGVTRGLDPGLDPRIYLLRENSLRRRWIAGSSLAMTNGKVDANGKCSSTVNLKFLSLLAASSFRNFKFKTALES